MSTEDPQAPSDPATPATHHVSLMPLGVERDLPHDTPLQGLLQELGMEFPCGGKGVCGGCRVKVLEGELPVPAGAHYPMDPADLARGWRYACVHHVVADVTLEVGQWDMPVLLDDTRFTVDAQEALGIAIDLGSTTLAAQLLDLRDGHVVGVESTLNPQARHGGDIMSRVCYAVEHGQQVLVDLIRQEIGNLVAELLKNAPQGLPPLKCIVIVGNTPMHNFFCNVDVTPLAAYPFTPESDGLMVFAPAELGWDLPADVQVSFLPSLGSFVGSDILAGLLATRLHEHEEVAALIDLGTNGEIVVGNREHLVCASTAAGPAFEAARIHHGMRAARGAITEVHPRADGTFDCRTIGHAPAKGICGSGLVDAVAAGLESGHILESGRLADGAKAFTLCDGVDLTQSDVRELQLAKGAIAVGLRLLLKRLGHSLEDLTAVYLAGAFGNYIRLPSAVRIGLLEAPPEKIRPAGNTALLGAKVALCADHNVAAICQDIRSRMEHVSLNTDPEFQDEYVDALAFPEE